MATNIVILARDRSKLTYQTLRTLYQNTRAEDYTLTLVDDQSVVPIESEGWVPKLFPNNGTVLRISPSQHITGKARNLGVYWSEKYWGRGEYLYLSDNDVAFRAGWLPKMTEALILVPAPRVLGGYQHAYHGTNKDWGNFHQTDAVAGYSHLMYWEAWDQFGPLDGHAPGTGQSEDHLFCRKVVEAGGKVGYIHPPCIAVCGLTNTEGKPATGHETFERLPGLHYE